MVIADQLFETEHLIRRARHLPLKGKALIEPSVRGFLRGSLMEGAADEGGWRRS